MREPGVVSGSLQKPARAAGPGAVAAAPWRGLGSEDRSPRWDRALGAGAAWAPCAAAARARVGALGFWRGQIAVLESRRLSALRLLQAHLASWARSWRCCGV